MCNIKKPLFFEGCAILQPYHEPPCHLGYRIPLFSSTRQFSPVYNFHFFSCPLIFSLPVFLQVLFLVGPSTCSIRQPSCSFSPVGPLSASRVQIVLCLCVSTNLTLSSPSWSSNSRFFHPLYSPSRDFVACPCSHYHPFRTSLYSARRWQTRTWFTRHILLQVVSLLLYNLSYILRSLANILYFQSARLPAIEAHKC